MIFTQRSLALLTAGLAGLAPALATTSAASAAPGGAGAHRGTATAVAAPVTGRAGALVPGGTRLWAARYHAQNRTAQATSVAASPDGATVYVTGITAETSGTRARPRYDTAAYDAATGTTLWVARFTAFHGSSFFFHPAGAPAIAVSPDGSTVFVDGFTAGPKNDSGLTLAYDAATGAQLWLAKSPFQAGASVMAVSPDGSKVFVVGRLGFLAERRYVTVAYDAATGAQLWVADHNFHHCCTSATTSIAVTPDGSRVFVTGTAGTIALDSANGAQVWALLYRHRSHRRVGGAMAVSPDGSTVFVTFGFPVGSVTGPNTVVHVTKAYSAATGEQLWAARYSGLGESFPASIAVSPDGSRVFVLATTGTGASRSPFDVATLAYTAATGAQLWARRFERQPGQVNFAAFVPDLALSPDGSKVFITSLRVRRGSPDEYATFAYDAATGATVWSARYHGPAKGDSDPASIAVSPDGSKVYVTGSSQTTTGASDYATVAYQS
jgi:DNA-binding beta-propeller fold protein YncE